jgi:hypothetical protein
MTTHTRTSPTERAARRAAQTPRATGAPDRDIHRSRAPHHTDTRREPVGGYAEPLAPDAPTGTYGDRALQRHHGTGSLAGDPDHQRHGTYADTDRVTIITHNGDAERTRITGPRGTRRPLHRTALHDDTIDRAARAPLDLRAQPPAARRCSDPPARGRPARHGACFPAPAGLRAETNLAAAADEDLTYRSSRYFSSEGSPKQANSRLDTNATIALTRSPSKESTSSDAAT